MEQKPKQPTENFIKEIRRCIDPLIFGQNGVKI